MSWRRQEEYGSIDQYRQRRLCARGYSLGSPLGRAPHVLPVRAILRPFTRITKNVEARAGLCTEACFCLRSPPTDATRSRKVRVIAPNVAAAVFPRGNFSSPTISPSNGSPESKLFVRDPHGTNVNPLKRFREGSRSSI